MTDPTLADLAVRVARAEMERDAALEREAKAKQGERSAFEAYRAFITSDREKLLETLTIIGIPARDLKDIYEIENIWRREGGTQSMLDWYRKQRLGT